MMAKSIEIDLDFSDIDDIEDNPKEGMVIQRALLKEMKKSTKYARIEATISCRFDAIMLLPEETEFFATMENPPLDCIHMKGKTRCYEKYHEVIEKCTIPHAELRKRMDVMQESRKDGERVYWSDMPAYRHNDREYKTEKSLISKEFRKEVLCNPEGCELYAKQLEIKKKNNENYNFLPGLHVFEIKSNKDKFDLLQHQIPNMVAIADYVWLVLGDKMKVPEWLPPYISVMVYHSDTKKFTIERQYKIKISNPPMYWQVFQAHGYKIETKELYAFCRMMRAWQINSMFHFMFDSPPPIDMAEDIKELIGVLKLNEKKLKKENQASLFSFTETVKERKN